ncbi:YbbN family protein [Hymenobacter jeollabukensis]|uniref:Thioredoxin family protein n=1 Tax=Hymenobacter jeollabukensis TaxID=2025313 RepID=A0A5R8WJ92_9BACT|nr:thioredoxin family protein [Hymenobacter jeollabukensis]TLM88673.1 thioredoxin family protein [Hymenobacter jeollabukensis]
MLLSTLLAAPPTYVAMLLVLLPAADPQEGQLGPAVRLQTLALLQALQQQVAPFIRVLRIDQATYPAVVRSFDGRGVPAFVLVRDGVELWRQQGLPEGEQIAQLLLSKL